MGKRARAAVAAILGLDEQASDAAFAAELARAILPHLATADLCRLRRELVPAEYRRRTVGLPGPEGEVGSHAIHGKVVN